MSTLPVGGGAPIAAPAQLPADDPAPAPPIQDASWLTRSYGDTGSGPAIIGHRGVTGHANVPENSIEALQYAASHRADGIELDIQFLGDGTPVVHHDDAIKDGGWFWFDKDLSDLDASDLAINGGDHDLLTLEQWAEAYAALPEPRPAVFAEFKKESVAQIDDPGSAIAGAVEILDAHVARDQLVAASFGTDVLKHLHEADPTLQIGLFADRGGDTSVFEQLDQLEADGISVSFVQMNEDNLSVEDASHGITASDPDDREDQTLDRLYGEGYAIVIGHTEERYIADSRVSAIISNDPATATDTRDATLASFVGEAAREALRYF